MGENTSKKSAVSKRTAKGQNNNKSNKSQKEKKKWYPWILKLIDFKMKCLK